MNASATRIPKHAWGPWLLGAAAWGAHLGISYGMVEWYCRNADALQPSSIKLLLHGTTLVCFVLAVTSVWLGYRHVRMLNAKAVHRNRFMAKTGMLISLFFALLIAVQGLPNLVFEPCL
jgi:uncharacterized membrane protein